MVPSIVLLAMWALFSSYTVFEGLYLQLVASGVKDASIPAVQSFASLQKERELSMTSLSRPGTGTTALAKQQSETDADLAKMKTAFSELASQAPQEVVDGIGKLNGLLDQLPDVRARLESGAASKDEVYRYYNSLLDSGASLFTTQARIVPDAETVTAALLAPQSFQAVDSMSRSGSVAAAALAAGRFTPEEHREFSQLVGSYRSALAGMEPFVLPEVRDHYKRIVASPQWQQLATMENRLLQIAERPIGNQVTLADWENTSRAVSTELTTMVEEQSNGAVNLAMANGKAKFTSVLIGSLVALIAVIVGILVAVRVSNRLVNKALIVRLTSLKSDSLKLAHERLPDIVERLRDGKHVDVAAEVPALDYGNDEIGQVADAFNAAQYTAVAAAVKESQTREGVNRVFLDIARRNQGLVHRQLKILDKLEREEENPDHLDAFFQLDHLATRARRNAENLIILTGEQPGRQWRKPVRMLDVVRAAVAETEQYARVKVNPVPEVALVGAAVADIIHLIAELVDNATSFSSPRSQVEIHSSEVPQGLVIEIEDHGLGIKSEDREQHNKMLAAPPDFEAMRLRGESRLGLFVVARLAARRHVRVELRDCPSGGTIALVLIPSELVVGEAGVVEPVDTTQMPKPSFRQQALQQAVAPAETVPAVEPSVPMQGDLAKDSRPTETFQLNEFWSGRAVGNGGDPGPEGDLDSSSGHIELPREDRLAGAWPTDDPAEGEKTTRQDTRPELPRRRRQQHLVPQLANDDLRPMPDLAEFNPEERAERTRNGMSAFQRGTRDARQADDVVEP
ncbi:nitrate- and nitrite sensing domain-containing protein [Lentzea sp. DG1S-22]|uniref:sensor histidine kinase n=1 Tax=Lentzea sp. DG1S-22 TaxID=3108822 RepID=UPI002E79E0FF|nr:nitrate- and nitrite sensing domain-containing protein [Lentzea sp. DG1S-22]WVH84242.1 nitrate- and nitrite sensing domain-containing protein [Lentzea sp. DG1S-22]